MGQPELYGRFELLEQKRIVHLHKQGFNARLLLCSGVGSALIVALSLRRASSGIVKSASGNKLLMLNGLIGSVGAGTASYFNTQAMRRAEA